MEFRNYVRRGAKIGAGIGLALAVINGFEDVVKNAYYETPQETLYYVRDFIAITLAGGICGSVVGGMQHIKRMREEYSQPIDNGR